MAKPKDMTPTRKYREAPLSRLSVVQQTHDDVPEILWLTRYTRISATQVAFVFQGALAWMTGGQTRLVKMVGQVEDELSLNYVLTSLGLPDGEVGERVIVSQYSLHMAPICLAIDTSKRRVTKLRHLTDEEVARVTAHAAQVLGESPLIGV